MSIDEGWLCHREFEIVPDGKSRVTEGGYRFHLTSEDLHTIGDGWTVEQNPQGRPLMRDGKPVLVAIDIEPTEAE